MHKVQLKILELSRRKNVLSMGFREIGREIGIPHPQIIKYHIGQLRKEGLLAQENGVLDKLRQSLKEQATKFLRIPILGAANCGIPTLIAEESHEGFLEISQKLVDSSRPKDLFALKASGNSLNRADIEGLSVEDGDYLIVDTSYKNPKDDDYVVSIIDGCANVKKVRLEKNRIILLSESSENIPPIYIHPEDSYLVNGKVIQVIKKPTEQS